MAAYGVIGGFIGAAIAAVITPILIKRARKQYNKQEHKEPESYRPGVSWFVFLIGVVGTVLGVFLIRWLITDVDFTKISNIRSLSFISLLYFILMVIMPFFMFFFGILMGCWGGSFLGAQITVSKEKLVIEHAAKLPKINGSIDLWYLGKHHLDLRWEDIRELRGNRNFMKIILHNDECYMFPIGWCKDAAWFSVERYKKINPLE